MCWIKIYISHLWYTRNESTYQELIIATGSKNSVANNVPGINDNKVSSGNDQTNMKQNSDTCKTKKHSLNKSGLVTSQNNKEPENAEINSDKKDGKTAERMPHQDNLVGVTRVSSDLLNASYEAEKQDTVSNLPNFVNQQLNVDSPSKPKETDEVQNIWSSKRMKRKKEHMNPNVKGMLL